MSNKVLSQSANKNFPIIPRLENGDRLTQKEFHRRYEAMPKNVKAELIKGVVYMASPVRVKNHGKPHARMMGFLSNYQMLTNGIDLLDNTTFIVDEFYEPQPDCVLRIEEEFGGKSWINEDDYLEGSPELIVEIAASTASYDLHDKLEMYEKKGIQEYIVWRVLDKQIDWFSLENEKYQKIEPNKQGIIESKTFIGLRLNVEAIITNDLRKVLNDLQKGISSKKYKEFSAQLVK